MRWRSRSVRTARLARSGRGDDPRRPTLVADGGELVGRQLATGARRRPPSPPVARSRPTRRVSRRPTAAGSHGWRGPPSTQTSDPSASTDVARRPDGSSPTRARRRHCPAAVGWPCAPTTTPAPLAAAVVVVRPHQEVQAVEPRLGVRRVGPRFAGDRLRRAERARVDEQVDDDRSTVAQQPWSRSTTACGDASVARSIVHRLRRPPIGSGAGSAIGDDHPAPEHGDRVDGHGWDSTHALSRSAAAVYGAPSWPTVCC